VSGALVVIEFNTHRKRRKLQQLSLHPFGILETLAGNATLARVPRHHAVLKRILPVVAPERVFPGGVIIIITVS
jgi:hypothetical protein